MKQTIKTVEIAVVASRAAELEKYLAHRGVFEPCEADLPAGFETASSAEELSETESELASVERLLTVLSGIGTKEKSGIAGLFASPEPVDDSRLCVDEASLADALNACRSLDRAEELQTKMLRARTSAEQLEPWLRLDASPDREMPDGAVLIVGSIAARYPEEEINRRIAVIEPSLEEFELRTIYNGDNLTCIAAVCLKGRENVLENALRQLGFSRFTPPETGTPSEVRDKYLSRADELDAEITRLESEVA
ncbi:MAG: hypothetical protein K6C36_05130, partial [Clostridia bacterium]|nr:hypothetical protein [Clostridia bacterium]